MSEELIENENEGKELEKPVNKGGRPLGSTNRPKLLDYMSVSEREEYIKHYLKRAKENDKVLQHLLDHMLGKAPQDIDLRGELISKLVKLD